MENNKDNKNKESGAPSNGVDSNEYLKKIKERSKNKHISKSYQLTGLEVAKLLEDWDYRGLHIKLAKDIGETKLRMLAKAVAEQKNIPNKGAYLMKILYPDKDEDSHKPKQKGR